MPSFSYRAVDANGNIVSGDLEAASERALETQLRQQKMRIEICHQFPSLRRV